MTIAKEVFLNWFSSTRDKTAFSSTTVQYVEHRIIYD